MDTATSKNGVPVRLTEERWNHIVEEHGEIDEYIRMLPTIKQAPQSTIWTSYDSEADVLYVNFKKPSFADDSELTEDDVVIRYEKGVIIGLTILNASKRLI